MKDPKNKGRCLLQVSIKPDLYEQMKARCEELDVPMAIWTRQLITRELERAA